MSAEREAIRLQLQEVEHQLAIAEAREDIISFQQWMMPDPNRPDDPKASRYKPSEHHRLLGMFLMGVMRGQILRLAVSMPPQHGKSQLCSRAFPAMYAGLFPYRNLMMGTYSQDFANEFGDDVRSIMESERYHEVYPETQFRKGSRAKDHMVTLDEGKLSFLGRKGAGTGRPADVFLIDDPLKDAVEASSLSYRNEVWEWYTRVAYSRTHALSAIIIIMTRWSEDDLIARLTDARNPYYDPVVAKQWTVINFPAILEPPDAEVAKLLKKNVGEVLWPERFTHEHLDTAKRMNPEGFSALYQGRPVPPGGAYFKQEMIYTYERNEMPPMKELRAYGTGDLAVSQQKGGNKSAVGTWLVDKDWNVWLHPDLYWEKKPADATVEHIIIRGKTYKWLTFWGEAGAIDKSVGPFLKRRMRDTKTNFHVDSFTSSSDKGMRAIPIRGLMALGKVKFPKFAPWWPAAYEQLLSFTGIGDDREDDFVDMCAIFGQAMDKLMAGSGHVETKVEGNVIKVGTFGWIKQQTKAREDRERGQRAIAGY